jgi:hypothetical protein
MRAEVTFLGGVIFGIDENGVVRTRCHAGFTTDADGFVKIHYTVRALEHRRGGAGGDTGRMGALVTARHLMRASCLRERPDIDVFYVSPRDRKRNNIL